MIQRSDPADWRLEQGSADRLESPKRGDEILTFIRNSPVLGTRGCTDEAVSRRYHCDLVGFAFSACSPRAVDLIHHDVGGRQHMLGADQDAGPSLEYGSTSVR